MFRTAYRPPGDSSLWDSFLYSLERTMRVSHIHPSTVEWLTHPVRSLTLSLPVQMHDGRVRFFDAHRVVHDMSRGPAFGGVRYHPSVSLGQTCGLAAWMTLKAAVYNLPYGGSAGGIALNPRALSEHELEKVSRRYVSALGSLIGPEEDILAPDVGTNAQVMAWYMDTYSMNVGQTVAGVVTGKPPSLGGSALETEAGGQALIYVLEELARRKGLPLKGASLAVQGFGYLGRSVARTAVREGLKVVAVATSQGGVYDPQGLDVAALEAHYQQHGHLQGFPAQPLLNEHLLQLPVDYLVPAAQEGVLHRDNASKVQAKVILEGANGAITPEADALLRSHGKIVVPDVVAGGGGMVLSYLEWVQGLVMFFWDQAEVEQRLRDSVHETFEQVYQRAQSLEDDLRLGAYALAIERINEAALARGVYP
jgi:glutamate dehydrogenase (NAD(P)+)